MDPIKPSFFAELTGMIFAIALPRFVTIKPRLSNVSRMRKHFALNSVAVIVGSFSIK
jgi:hypothetical protein